MDGPPSIEGLRGSPQRTAQQAVAPQEPAGVSKSERLEGIDVLRGLVMAVMVLDHTRDYFSNSNHSPTDLAQTSVTLFFTRWLTHFCAPVFFLLAGTGAYLSGRRSKTRSELAWFLLSRGGFLVVLDLTIVRLGWDFNFLYSGGPMFVVLSALGFSMMALAGLIYLPPPWIAAVGASLILFHNLADNIAPAQLGAFAPLWTFLHVRGPAEVAGVPFYVSYPLIPWVGVMALGYAIGPFFELERTRRRRLLLLTGLSLLAAFVVLRATNLYGDLRPWRHDADEVTSFLSFLNTTKYPPSLLYLLMTLGPALVVLAAFDAPPSLLGRALIPLGRTALFFYVLHLYLIHVLALGLGIAQGYNAGSIAVFYTDLPEGYGVSLVSVYLLWLVVLVLLYPLCLWYARLKKQRHEVWMSYL